MIESRDGRGRGRGRGREDDVVIQTVQITTIRAARSDLDRFGPGAGGRGFPSRGDDGGGGRRLSKGDYGGRDRGGDKWIGK
jgi:hypothetical protein